MFADQHFTLTVTFKREDDAAFAAVHGLVDTIVRTAGSGAPADPFVFDVTVENRIGAPWTGVVEVTLAAGRPDARFFLPGYLYGRNGDASRLQPRLIKEFPRLRAGGSDIPFAPAWHLRADQLTHPVAVLVADGRLWGLSGGPYLTRDEPLTTWAGGETDGFAGYNGFSCSVEDGAQVGYTLGYAELPGVFTTPWRYDPYTRERQGCITVPAGGAFTFEVRVYCFEAEGEADLGRVLEHVYGLYHQAPRMSADVDGREVATGISHALTRDAFEPSSATYSVVSLVPTSSATPTVFEPRSRFEAGDYTRLSEGLIGWTNGTVIAVPLLQAADRLGDDRMRRQAEQVIDHIVAHCLDPVTGIPYCAEVDGVWTNRGWWTPWIESEGVAPGHSSYIIGQALYYLLKAYDWELAHGRERATWLAFAGRVIDRVLPTQDDDGAFPRFWDEETGAGRGYDAFAGCWVAAAVARYARVTGRADLLDAARRAESRYHRDVARMECSLTPLDVADAPDSEGVLAYVRLARVLSELLGGAEAASYVNRMRAGLDYALSFVYCYNVPAPAEPLRSMGWSSSGGSVTSVCNAVIHCMLGSVLDDMHAYCERTGDPYYGRRLADVEAWGLQVANRRECERGFGRIGWSSEYFCQADRYVLDVRLPGGERSSVWFAYHPWATASVLEGLCGDRWERWGDRTAPRAEQAAREALS